MLLFIGNTAGRKVRSDAIVDATKHLRKISGPVLVHVTFKLTREKVYEANPYCTDLDNLLKRSFDALSKTVFSEAPDKDACIVAIAAAKVLVHNPSESGVDGEIIEMAAA